jgi:hypothetical protein
MQRITDVRMSGISAHNLNMFRQLCGDSNLKNTVIVTSLWGEVRRKVGEAREAELANNDTFFKPVLDKGARLFRHHKDVKSAQGIIPSIIGNQPCTLQIQHELGDLGKDISQTAAGEELNHAELCRRIPRNWHQRRKQKAKRRRAEAARRDTNDAEAEKHRRLIQEIEDRLGRSTISNSEYQVSAF